jgi:hypothetical protein
VARFSEVDLQAGDVIAETARRYAAWFPRIATLYAVIFGPYLALYALGVFKPLGVYGPSVILSVLFPLADGALTSWLLKPELSFDKAFVRGVKVFLPLLMTRFLKYVAIGVGVVALVIPAVMMTAWFSLSDPLIVEGTLGKSKDPFAPLFKSRRIVRGHVLPVIVAMAPLLLITQVGGLAPVVWGGVAQENADPALWTHFFNVFLDLMYLGLTVMSVVLYERLALAKAEAEVLPTAHGEELRANAHAAAVDSAPKSEGVTDGDVEWDGLLVGGDDEGEGDVGPDRDLVEKKPA